MESKHGWKQKAKVMTDEDMERALKRMAHEIAERNKGIENVILVGIHRRGVPLAERIADLLEQFEGKRPAMGRLDITLYRMISPFATPSLSYGGPTYPGISKVSVSCWWMTCSTRGVPFGPLWMPLWILAGRIRYSWRCWWIEGIGSFPSIRIMWVKIFPRRRARWWRFP